MILLLRSPRSDLFRCYIAAIFSRLSRVPRGKAILLSRCYIANLGMTVGV